MARILLALMCLSGWPYSTCLQYHYVADQKTWTEAQTYCRQNYDDLATIGNIEQNNQLIDTITSAGQRKVPNKRVNGRVKSVAPRTKGVWFGLHRFPNNFWSDGSSFTFSNLNDTDEIYLNSSKVICGVTSSTLGQQWRFLSCEEKLPFVCYSQVRNLKTLKLKITPGNSTVDLNDPAVKEDILKKLEERLKLEVGGVNLKWRNLRDEKVPKTETCID